MKEIHEKAQAYDKTLLATDPRFNNSVLVRGINDLYQAFYPHAFVLSYKCDEGFGVTSKDHWYMIFTEHYGAHVHHSDDVDVVQFGPMKIENYITHTLLG